MIQTVSQNDKEGYHNGRQAIHTRCRRISNIAKQVAQEEQESYLVIDELEGISFLENRNYDAHIQELHSEVLNALDCDIEDILEECKQIDNNKYADVFSDYISADINDKQALKMYKFLNNEYYAWWQVNFRNSKSDFLSCVCTVLEIITGHKHEQAIISGSVQGDWQGVIYDCDMWNKETLDALAIEYFNMGTEWIIDHDNITESFYSCALSFDEIKKELCESLQCKPDDLIMLAFAGYEQIIQYKEVM